MQPSQGVMRGAKTAVGKKKPGTIRLAMDFGSKKDKDNYTKNGPVIQYNKKGVFIIMENGKIAPWSYSAKGIECKVNNIEELLEIADPKEAQDAFKEWAMHKSDAGIAHDWDMPMHILKRIRSELGIIKDRTGNIIKTYDKDKINWPLGYKMLNNIQAKLQEKQQKEKNIKNLPKTGELPKLQPVDPRKEKAKASYKGMHLKLEGTFLAQLLIERLEALRETLIFCENIEFSLYINEVAYSESNEPIKNTYTVVNENRSIIQKISKMFSNKENEQRDYEINEQDKSLEKNKELHYEFYEEGFSVNMEGTFTADEVNNRLEALKSIIPSCQGLIVKISIREVL